MSEFTPYRRKQIAYLRPYKPGEDVALVSISPEDLKSRLAQSWRYDCPQSSQRSRYVAGERCLFCCEF
jgi:hypothetical protein